MAEKWNMQKIKHLTALPESNTSKIWTPKSSFINQKQIYKRASSVPDSQIFFQFHDQKMTPSTLLKGNDPNG